MIMGVTGVTIKTGSMTPRVNVGDYVLIRKTRADKIKENDIITFVTENILVTHRVEKVIYENGQFQYLTKGDANNTVDTTIVDFSNVVGKSLIVVRGLGNLFAWISTTEGLLILGGIILFLIFLPDKKKKVKKLTLQRKAEKTKDHNKTINISPSNGYIHQ